MKVLVFDPDPMWLQGVEALIAKFAKEHFPGEDLEIVLVDSAEDSISVIDGTFDLVMAAQDQSRPWLYGTDPKAVATRAKPDFRAEEHRRQMMGLELLDQIGRRYPDVSLIFMPVHMNDSYLQALPDGTIYVEKSGYSNREERERTFREALEDSLLVGERERQLIRAAG